MQSSARRHIYIFAYNRCCPLHLLEIVGPTTYQSRINIHIAITITFRLLYMMESIEHLIDAEPLYALQGRIEANCREQRQEEEEEEEEVGASGIGPVGMAEPLSRYRYT